ncbi:hypothetical protein [Streptomyces sp. NPDC092952]|uniref:hypothetical protein n=1 Tax=Streptomyces sp. NPDC092952 TaxID=3366018 RepID=UPI0037FF1B6D
MLWRLVLSALKDDTLDEDRRLAILARGAAQLAAHRLPDGRRPTSEDVVRAAFEEFAVVIDAAQARTALRHQEESSRRRKEGPHHQEEGPRREAWGQES